MSGEGAIQLDQKSRNGMINNLWESKKTINLKGASGKMVFFTASNKKRTAKVDLTNQLQVKP